jgi:hypothetical protein
VIGSEFIPAHKKYVTVQKFNTQKLNDPSTSSAFEGAVSSKIMSLPPDLSIQQKTDNLIETLIDTSNTVLGKATKQDIPHWMSQQTKDAISDKHKIRANNGHKSEQYKAQKSVVKQFCKLDKENLIDREHKELNDLPLDTKYYTIMKCMKLS